MKRIEVFLRQCYYSPCQEIGNREFPDWYSKEKSFKNFQDTVDKSLVDYTIVYDNYYGKKKDTFLKNEKIIEIRAGDEATSFLMLLDIIKSKDITDDTIIYIIEDDYVHRPSWCKVLLEGFELPVDMVSLYDHKIRYIDEVVLLSEIFVTKSCHWRTVPYTTNTHALKYKTLMEEFEIYKVWSETANNGITNDVGRFESLQAQGKKLISPMPSYATHKDMIAPIINWQNI